MARKKAATDEWINAGGNDLFTGKAADLTVAKLKQKGFAVNVTVMPKESKKFGCQLFKVEYK